MNNKLSSDENRKINTGCFIVFLIVFIPFVAFVNGCFSSSETQEQKTEDKKLMAWRMATTHFVADALDSPSTASFPDMSDQGVVVYDNGDKTYNILGYVDAQNAFGSTVRTKFACKIRDNGERNWTCTSLEIIE